jgi:hypothetical protein
VSDTDQLEAAFLYLIWLISSFEPGKKRIFYISSIAPRISTLHRGTITLSRILVWENCFDDVCAGRGIGKDIATGFAPSRPDGSGSLLPLILSSASTYPSIRQLNVAYSGHSVKSELGTLGAAETSGTDPF